MSLARNSRAVLAVALDSRRGFRPAHLRARRNSTSPALARRRFSTTQLPPARCFTPRPGCGGDQARNTSRPLTAPWHGQHGRSPGRLLLEQPDHRKRVVERHPPRRKAEVHHDIISAPQPDPEPPRPDSGTSESNSGPARPIPAPQRSAALAGRRAPRLAPSGNRGAGATERAEPDSGPGAPSSVPGAADPFPGPRAAWSERRSKRVDDVPAAPSLRDRPDSSGGGEGPARLIHLTTAVSLFPA